MVPAKLGKHVTSSNNTLEENEAAENDLDETKTSDSGSMNVEQPNTGVQVEDDVKISLDEAKNENTEKTNSGERKKAITADNDYENTRMTEINGDNLAEREQSTSEDDEIDYEVDAMWGNDEENSEEDNERNAVDKDEFNFEVETEEDDDESGEDDEELEEDDEELAEDDEDLAEDNEDSEEDDDDNQNEEEEEKEHVDGDGGGGGDGGKSEEPKTEKVEAISKEEVDKSRGRSRKKVQARRSKKLESGYEEKPESSRKRKAKNRVETMGMIFMCSSATKNDCYRYRVLGLPASKKNMVEKIYAGMRLFLYDVDLKLLNGIYKAAGPGGYNIEPKAFKSQFPSQVRFTVLEDCLPVAEEKFKKVIKDNYFTKTKFDCLLTSEQVKKLCKLFVATSKGRRQIRLNRSRKAENQTTERRDRPRKQIASEETRHAVREALSYRNRLRKRQRKIIAPGPPVRQSLPLPVPAHHPSTVPSYAYERTLELDAYRQYPYIESRDPYRDGRDPPTERRRYRDERVPPTERRDSYRDGRELPAERRDYYEDGRDPPAVRRDSYRDGRDPPADRRDSYRDGRDPPAVHRDSYRDGRDPPAVHRDSYRDGRDPPAVRRDSYRDGRNPLTVHRDSYRDGRDPLIERGVSYRDGQDPYRSRQSPYRDGRDSYVEHPYRDGRDPRVGRRSPYRDRRDTYIERHDPFNDVRDSYLQRSGPYRDGLQLEPSETHRRDPISDRRYIEDRLAKSPDSYRQKVLLEQHDLRPAHLETRWLHDISSQDSYRVRVSHAEPTYAAEYPSRVGLERERDYRPASLLTARHSTTGRLPEYYPR